MIEKDLVNIFNECVDRLAAGQTIEDCLRQYPQHATQLRPMLEVGMLTRRVVPPTAEVMAAQVRVRQRIETLVQTMPPQRQPMRLFTQRVATLAASLILVFLISIGGSAALAQDSLPGDFLYGMKLLTENVRLAVAPDVFGLTAEFNQRRVDETRQLITFKRQAELEFEGSVSVIDATTWEIAGLPVSIPAELMAQVQTGDKVRVRVETTTNGEIHVVEIIETEHLAPPATPTPLPTAAPSQTPSHTPSATLTVTSSHTPAPTETPSSTPTATLTVTSSHTPSHTPMPTETPSSTPTVTATPTKTPTSTRTPILLVTNTFAPSQTPSPTPDVCVPQRPDRWQTYRVQAGDTLSGLAASRGVLLSQVIAVNCLVDAGFIVVGQELFLPVLLATAAPPSSGDNGQSGNGSDNSNNNDGNGNSNDNGNDNDDDHNDNDD